MNKTEYIITARTECYQCNGLGTTIREGYIHLDSCTLCHGSGDIERPVNLLDVLRKLRFTLSGDADERQQWGAFEDLEVWDGE